MSQQTFSYIGEKYSQGSSSLELISFCASANDIYAWGGVPAKTERFHGGFQRALSDRHKNIKKFFDDGQASPTSIVVAFREGVLSTTDLGRPDAWPHPDDLRHTPEFVHVSFKAEDLDEDTPLKQLREQVVALLKPRLDAAAGTEEELVEETAPEQEASNDDDEEDGDSDEENDDFDDSGDELDVGQSKLRAFFDFIESEDNVKQWVESENHRYNEIKNKAKQSKRDKTLLEFPPEDRLKSLLISLLRPAIIVDGQHRVWGAYHSDQSPLLFNVCAIKDTSWIEQVFQFVVLNKLAKPISTSFLTGLLNTSLTNTEVREIEERLENIGIKNTDRRIVKYLNYDDRSPFIGMIAEAGEVAGIDNTGRLSDKGMIRLAKRWKQVASQKLELMMFFPALDVTNLTNGRKKWKSYETWIPFFYGFWDVIKAKYDKDGIWVKDDDYSLLYIVTMHAMQDMFIENLSEGNVQFSDLADFRDRVKTFFQDVPGTFFQGWEATGLQSGDGPDHIRDAIMELRKGTQLRKVRKDSVLFKKLEKK